jgi:hypothetical protein
MQLCSGPSDDALYLWGPPGFQRQAGPSTKPCDFDGERLPKDRRSAFMNTRGTPMPSCIACSRAEVIPNGLQGVSQPFR